MGPLSMISQRINVFIVYYYWQLLDSELIAGQKVMSELNRFGFFFLHSLPFRSLFFVFAIEIR